MAIDLGDEAAAVVRMLRYLEREYRDLRPDPVGRPCLGLVRAESRLRNEMSRALARAYRAGMLPSLIADKITAVEDEVRAAGRVSLYVDVGIGLPCDVIGYVDAVGLDEDGEPGGDHLFLCPGSISLVWPEVFGPIYVAGVVGDDVSIETAFDAQSIVYIVLGYYAEACRMLADWIEGHFAIEPVVAVSADPSVNALRAVVVEGLADVLHAAGQARATDKASAIISDRLAKDQTLYEWGAQDWADDLGMSKPTIIKCDAWKEIMRWREANKVSKKTRQ